MSVAPNSPSHPEMSKFVDIIKYMKQLGANARMAAEVLAQASPKIKNLSLHEIAQVIDSQRAAIKSANLKDMTQAKSDGLDAAMLDRLLLCDDRIDAMTEGLRQVAALQDPVGEISEMEYRPSGVQIGKMRVPLGVIGIIYESRPNVTIDAAALCIKSGNASILRGGKEALNSNQAIYDCIKQGLKQAGLSEHSVQVVNTPDRAAVGVMLNMSESIDVIIPRGGKSLIQRISKESAIPVIKHLDGICHVFIDDMADKTKAFDIALNAKTRRYGVCNAMETLLVAASVANSILPDLIDAYVEKGVQLRAALASQVRVIIALVLRETRASYGKSRLGYLWEILIPAAATAAATCTCTPPRELPPPFALERPAAPIPRLNTPRPSSHPLSPRVRDIIHVMLRPSYRTCVPMRSRKV